MKVLFVMDVFIFGGCEKMLVKIIDVLIERGFQVTLLLLNRSNENTYLKYVNKKVKIVYLWETYTENALVRRIRFWISILFPGLVCRGFPREHFDYTIAFKESLQLTILCSRLKSRKIAWIQNMLEEFRPNKRKGLKMKLANVVYRLVYYRFKHSFSRFDQIICVSEQCRNRFYQVMGQLKNVEVKYNYIDEMELLKSANAHINESCLIHPVFCYVGRLSQEKGVVRLIGVVNRLIMEGFQLGLVVIGDGYQETECRELIQKHHNEQSIVLLGSKDNPYPYIKNADWCICASERESFGLAVVEAMCLKTPVISTRCGGPQETLGNGKYGILVENSEEGIYQGIRRILENPGLHAIYQARCEEGARRFKKETQITAVCKIFS